MTCCRYTPTSSSDGWMRNLVPTLTELGEYVVAMQALGAVTRPEQTPTYPLCSIDGWGKPTSDDRAAPRKRRRAQGLQPPA